MTYLEEEAMFVEKFAFALLHFSAGVSASALPTDLHLPPLEPTPFLRRKRGLHSSPMLQTVSQQPNLELAAGARAEVAHESWTNSLAEEGGASIPSTRQGSIVSHVASL